MLPLSLLPLTSNVCGMRMIFKKIIFGFGLLLGVMTSSSSVALAQTVSATPSTAASNLRGCPDGRGSCTLIVNPIASRGTDLFVQVGGVVSYALKLVGSATLFMIVWGGFQWLTAAGNAEKVEQGTKTMLWAAIGVAVVFISNFALGTYLDYLTGAK